MTIKLPVSRLVLAAIGLAVCLAFVWLIGAPDLPPARGIDEAPSRPGGPEPTGPDPADAVPGPVVETLVSADAGGWLALPGGLGRLEVPPRSVPVDTTVRATVVAFADGSEGVDLQPEGLRFAAPATLELAALPGRTADECEVAVWEKGRGWVAEARAAAGGATDRVPAALTHFSLRRVRLRPGMNFPPDPRRARGTFFLESDPGNTFEAFLEGRWQEVARKAPAYRDLLKAGRLGRHDLIATGRLRAVARSAAKTDLLKDGLRMVMLPPAMMEVGTSGWVRLVPLDGEGRPGMRQVVARVVPAAGDAADAPDVVRLSRAAAEALGLAWGEDFGVTDGGERSFLRVRTAPGRDLPYVPLRVEPWTPARQ